ncbi:type I restriction-modification system subunit M [Rubritalea sp.]|uniref:type I restriction-modification system subunit M n=1 Tax=Rubritalea sp. TaxID=2109375 RepID=UPI003EF4A572
MLQNNPELKGKIDQLWNKFWSGGISNPLTAIEQITYLLFMKRLDDLDLRKQADAEFTGEPYTSKFEGLWIPPADRQKIEQVNTKKERAKLEKELGIEKHTLRWSEFKNYQAEEMLMHIQTQVFPFLKDLNGEESNFTHHMKNAVFIIPKPSLLVESIKTIDEVFEIMEKDTEEKGQAFQDIQGDVYEYLLSEIATAGKNGQFRTPRHIIKLMAELVQPQLGDRICDPACGSAGFLLGAYQYIVTDLARKSGKKDLPLDEDGFERTSVASTLTEKAQTILQQSLYGYDIDSTMVRLGLMNLMMHGVDEPNIDYQDTLSKSYNEHSSYDVIFANPPFTGSIDKGDVNEALTLNTTKSELLFLESIFLMLKKGGTACVVIPQGVLFGSGKAFKALRQTLVDKCELKAVISAPSGVFKPYAGVSTAILLFTKVYDAEEEVSRPASESTWFYDMESDGYSLDDKRTKLDNHGDLQEIIKEYHQRDPEVASERKAKFFSVPHDEIKKEEYDLSFSRYKAVDFDDVVYEKPSIILDRIIENEVGKPENDEKNDRTQIKGGIVKSLFELKGLLQ